MLKPLSILLFMIAGLSISLRAQDAETDSLMALLRTSKPDTNKVNLLKKIGGAVIHQEPRIAISYWKQALQLSKTLQYDLGIARNYINIGTGYSYLGKFDTTVMYADSAIMYCKKLKDIDRLALAYLNKADGLRNLEKFSAALQYCDSSLIYATQTNNTDRIARIYDIISGIYDSQRKFTTSLVYHNKALDLYQKDSNEMMVAQVYDDLAYTYVNLGKKDSAMIYLMMGIKIAERVEDVKNLSGYYYTAAKLYIDKGDYNQATVYTIKSLDYAKQMESNIQLATSYSLLCDLYIKQERYSDAVQAGKLAYDYAISEVQLTWQAETASMLAQAYTKLDDYKNAYKYLKISKELNDSIAQQHYNEQTSTLQTAFEVKEKDKEILLLNKDKELQQQRLSRQRIIIVGSILLGILFLIGIALLVNRYRLRNKMKELELRNQIAADLHDEVGSSLSSIKMLSQMVAAKSETDHLQKDILQKMSNNAQETVDKMSDIVWMIKPGENEGESLKQRMERFLYEIGTAANLQTIFIAEGMEALKLSMQQRKDVYLIFKESVNNAAKYAGSTKIEVSITKKDKDITLIVKDNGSGFDTEKIRRGNGLDNMRIRAKELKGDISIDSAIGKGTTIQLHMQV